MGSTFLIIIENYSMVQVGLIPKDKAVIDRSEQANIGNVIFAIIDSEFTVKFLGRNQEGNPRLFPANLTGAHLPSILRNLWIFKYWE